MREFFKDLNINYRNQEKLKIATRIIDEYVQAGYKLTLRQLYYQLVSKDIIPNIQSEYAKLSTLFVKARMGGMIDWEIIEDRIRIPYIPYWVDDINYAVEDTIRRYRLNRQEGQEMYIEVWVEKDALSSVLKPITSHYHIYLMVNRGYSSCTAMYDAYKRLDGQYVDSKDLYILYLGDHDPSGLDMVRDITDRLEEFGVYPVVEHLGITYKQIKKYNPPPNPAKITDPRAKEYINNYGNVSWEVDALPPNILHNLLVDRIEQLIDMKQFKRQLQKEKEDKEKLRKLVKKLD